jgi:hypothetical protein
MRILLFLIIVSSVFATDYYVATDGDDASADPTNIATPWLTIQNALNNVVAGDTVHIRAGTYPEELTLNTTGTSGNPIIIKAYDPGTPETVILDGSTVLNSGWTQCVSDEPGLTRGGTTNPNFASIYKKTITLSTIPYQNSSTGHRLCLFDDGVFCELAMDPDTDTMIAHNQGDDGWYLKDASSTTTVIVDADKFTSSDSSYYDDCIMLIQDKNNLMAWRGCASFSPAADAITLTSSLNESNPTYRYCIQNHPLDINEAGEYCFTWTANGLGEGAGLITVFFYPQAAGDLTDGSISYATKSTALFVDENLDYITLDGLEVRNYAEGNSTSDALLCYSGAYKTQEGWEIKNCNVHDCSIQYVIYAAMTDTKIHDNTFSNIGFHSINGTAILLGRGGADQPTWYCNDMEIYSNTFTGEFRSSIMRLYALQDSLVYSNVMTADTGTHGNGTSFYQSCNDVVIAYNISVGTNGRITFQDIGRREIDTSGSYSSGCDCGGDILFYSNIAQTTSDNARPVNWWPESDENQSDSGKLNLINNLMIRPHDFVDDKYSTILLNSYEGATANVINNIILYRQRMRAAER